MFFQLNPLPNIAPIEVRARKLINFAYPLHLHRTYEFICITEGVMRVEINGHEFDVRAGEGALILPNQPHAFSSPEQSCCWLAFFSSDHVPELKRITAESGLFHPVIKVPSADLHEQMLRLTESPLRLHAILYELAARYTEGESAPHLAVKNGDPVCRVVEYIDTHFSEAMTLEKMAKDLGYSYRYMSGVVNRFFKMPLPKVINRYRVNLACKLLRDTEDEITAIALRCGFGSMRNFNRSFKQLTGGSPREYRGKKD